MIMKFQYRQNLRSLQILFVDLTQVLLTEMVEDDTKMLTIFICQYVILMKYEKNHNNL